MSDAMTHKIPLFATTISLLIASAYEVDDEADRLAEEAAPDDTTALRSLSWTELVNRANAIKSVHAAHPLIDNPVIFAGIASNPTASSSSLADSVMEEQAMLGTIAWYGPYAVFSDCVDACVLFAGEKGGWDPCTVDECEESCTFSMGDYNGYRWCDANKCLGQLCNRAE